MRWSDRYKYNHHSNHIFSSLIEISFLWSFRCKKRNIRGIKRPHKKVKTILIFSSSCEGSLPDSSTVLWLTQNRSFRPVVIRSLWSPSFSCMNSHPAKIRSWRVDQFSPRRKPGVMRKLGCQEASAALVGCRVSPCCGLVWGRLRTAHPPPTRALHTYKTWVWVTLY